MHQRVLPERTSFDAHRGVSEAVNEVEVVLIEDARLSSEATCCLIRFLGKVAPNFVCSSPDLFQHQKS